MALNQYGFEMASGGAEPGIKQRTNTALHAKLPPAPLDKLEYLLAMRILASGQYRQYLSDATGAHSSFLGRIVQHYHVSWERYRDDALESSQKTGGKDLTFERLEQEFASIELDLRVARRAEGFYTADIPI